MEILILSLQSLLMCLTVFNSHMYIMYSDLTSYLEAVFVTTITGSYEKYCQVEKSACQAKVSVSSVIGSNLFMSKCTALICVGYPKVNSVLTAIIFLLQTLMSVLLTLVDVVKPV